MEHSGIYIAFLLIIYGAFSSKLRVMERKVDKKLVHKKTGETKMSKMIESLVNKNCKIYLEGELDGTKCTVLETDEDWVKVSVENRKGEVSLKLIRIDNINRVDIL